MKISTLYFSATYTTKRIVEAIASHLSQNITTYDITNDASSEQVYIPNNEILIVGIPVYAGRVTTMVVDRLRRCLISFIV